MPASMILRFRDLVKNTIAEHREILKVEKYVWWAWWAKPAEAIPRHTFAQFRSIITAKGGVWIYLLNSGTEELYKAFLTDIDESKNNEGKECNEPSKTPSYYRDAKYKAWFRLEKIQKVSDPDGEIRRWSYDEIDEFPDDFSEYFDNKRAYSVKELLNRRHRTIYFVKPYEASHADYFADPIPPVPPVNFINTPIVSKSDYVLHLSDLHFSAEHHAFALKRDVNSTDLTLSDLIVQDLKNNYEGKPPGAVIISGDLTWQGTKEEFNLAASFLREIRRNYNLDPYHFVLVPGNHDIQWSDQDEADYDRTKKVSKPPEEATQNYREFYKEVFGLEPESYFSMGRRYILGNFVALDIIGLNSCMLEQRHFAGYGYVTVSQLNDAASAMGWPDAKHGTKYRVLVLHHHLIPVTPEEEIRGYDSIYSLSLDSGQIIYRGLELEVDLAAHGHMHQPFVSTVSRASRGMAFPHGRSLAIHAAGSAGVRRDHVSYVGKNSYSVYSFDEGGVTVSVRSMSENVKGFSLDWQCRLSRNPSGGLTISSVA
jgi:predicted MPP superfamily phosphohydrolase